MTPNLNDIISHFCTEGRIESIAPLGEGFINDTFIVRTEAGEPDYILQRKNRQVFPDVPAMMNNIEQVTSHIKRKVRNPLRETLTVIPARDGLLYYLAPDGEYWAVCLFIDNTVTYEKASSPRLAYQGGVGIGRFQAQLCDFDKRLSETIKGFHNIRHRFAQWDASLAADAAGRVKDLKTEIGWIESRRKEMSDFWSLVERGVIPTRITHNDTKISNILFDKATDDVLCVIDLDTVMSSTSLNDVGDALRSYTNTTFEDDPDLNKVSMSMDMFKAYIEGYLSERRDTLVESERDYLAFSGLYITYEQVLRFLMDYIDGDKYYRIKYPEHNLVRTRSQERLLESMESQYKGMCSAVKALL